MNRSRVNFTLGVGTLEIVRASGNASRYIDEAVRLRDRRWRRALALLRKRRTASSVRDFVEHVRAGKELVAAAPIHRAARLLARELDAGNAALAALLKVRDEPATFAVRGVVERRRGA